jgi:hypothetical protein
MAWVTCPHCGFTQIPSAACLKCRRRFDRPPSPPPTPAPPTEPIRIPALPRRYVTALVAVAIALVVLAILWGSRSAGPAAAVETVEAATPAPWSLDLTGRWQGKAATTLPGPPSRPALREVFIETDRSGNVVAAGVILTDPSHGGAGAGYLTVPNGRERLRETAAAVLASPKGAPLHLDFIPFAPWAPQRERTWRAVEGQRRTAEDTTYLLLESLETDYLVQAGVNASGFLSYLYLSPEYASGRGTDALSKVIHPGSENSLRGFRNLVWDLSGAADFVTLQVGATLSGPAGTADRIVLHRR